ncbi:MAG: tetratricopeptide repeat protein [Candidatus Riflebacteria bacterium]|nr:tetratricopeptide repeat protein [Candidatus Riflebacteria bacterium]
MKKCSECGKPVSDQLMFCGVCGASLKQPVQSRRERLIFFITPLFLILVGVAFAFELGIADPVDSGMLFAGSFAMLFLGVATIFSLLTWLFRMPALPESYWQVGLFAVIHFVLCSFLVYNLEIGVIGEVARKVGPLQYSQTRLEMLLLIFLPTLATGIFAVSARAKMFINPASVRSNILKFLFKNTLFLLPALGALCAGVLYMSHTQSAQALIQARILHEIGASSQALAVIDRALEQHANYAPLHFLKGVVIIDAQPVNLRPVDARTHLEKAVAGEPGVPLYLFRLSMAFDGEKNGAEAIAAASEAISLLPSDAYLWQHLGDLNLKYKSLPAAVAAFKKALEIYPDNPMLLNNLAYTLLELNQDLPQALEMARMSVEAIPGMVFNLDTLAWAYYKNGMYFEALEVMNSIFHGRVAVTPEVDFHYAMILHATGMLQNPLQSFDELLVRPEIAADHALFNQVMEARNNIESDATKLPQAVEEPITPSHVDGEANEPANL